MEVDPITQEPIPTERVYMLGRTAFDVQSLAKLIQSGNTRNPITREIIPQHTIENIQETARRTGWTERNLSRNIVEPIIDEYSSPRKKRIMIAYILRMHDFFQQLVPQIRLLEPGVHTYESPRIPKFALHLSVEERRVGTGTRQVVENMTWTFKSNSLGDRNIQFQAFRSRYQPPTESFEWNKASFYVFPTVLGYDSYQNNLRDYKHKRFPKFERTPLIVIILAVCTLLKMDVNFLEHDRGEYTITPLHTAVSTIFR